MMIPKKFAFLTSAAMPSLVQEGMRHYGLLEGPGTANNPTIVRWADEVAKKQGTPYNKWAADWYNQDAVAWCGLFMAMLACRTAGDFADRLPPAKYLSALSWANFGDAVQFKGREGYRLNEIWTGDVGVFIRSGGGHVGTIVAVSENGKTVFVLGGNQSNGVNIVELSVERLYAVRRPRYRTRPVGARHTRMTSQGVVSTNEA